MKLNDADFEELEVIIEHLEKKQFFMSATQLRRIVRKLKEED